MVSSVNTVASSQKTPKPIHGGAAPGPPVLLVWMAWLLEAGGAESLLPLCKWFSEYKGLLRGGLLPPSLPAPPRRCVFPLVHADLTSVQTEQLACVPCDCGVSQELSSLPLLSTRRDNQSQVWWLWA